MPGSGVLIVPALLVVAILAIGLALGAGCAKEKTVAQRYHCPMHPTYISDRPGDCPICGMRLVPIDEKGERRRARRRRGRFIGGRAADGGAAAVILRRAEDPLLPQPDGSERHITGPGQG